MKPLVSVCCITYNQENYIAEAIEGFLMQKTDFPIEILIHDDASTDKTADIVREYEKKHPDLIKAIYQKENQYSKGVKVTPTYQFSRAKGKYIAMCEGDDYWTDPLKLQKQVDFLEGNPEYAICFHPVKILLEEEQKLVDDFITRKVRDITDIYDLAKGNYIHTPSVLFRNRLFDYSILLKNKSKAGDYFLHMLNAQFGKIKKVSDLMAVYRVHKDGIWALKDYKFRLLETLKLQKSLIEYIESEKKKNRVKKVIINSFLFQFIKCYKSSFTEELLFEFKKLFPEEFNKIFCWWPMKENSSFLYYFLWLRYFVVRKLKNLCQYIIS